MLKNDDYKYIKRVCYRECKNKQDAEDLTSILVIKLLSLKKDISIPYRNKLIRNTIVNYYTRGYKKYEFPTQEIDNDLYTYQPMLETKHNVELLYNAVWKLPSKQRKVIEDVLKYRSYKEISKDRNMSYDSVKVNYRHGLNTLRFLLTRRANYGILK